MVRTPIWLGDKSSVCTRVIERLYGGSSELNAAGRYAFYGRVGGVLVTGNEDSISGMPVRGPTTRTRSTAERDPGGRGIPARPEVLC